jgi:HlyD family secretion protein
MMEISIGARRLRILATAVCLATACRPAVKPDAYGTVEATEVIVAAQAAGQLMAFAPVEGQRLSAGASAAVVDTSALVLQLAQLDAQRASTGSRVNEVTKQLGVFEAQMTVAQRTYERTKRLYAQQAATAQQLDQAERDLHTLEAQLDATRAQRQTVSRDVVSSDARVAQIRDQIKKSRVLNPVAGTVLTTYAKAGEFVQVGQPLYKIANLDTMELRAYITEPQLAQVKLGQAVQVTIDAGVGARRSWFGTLSWISSEAEFTPTPIETRDERANLVYAIKVRLLNPGGVLKIGMPADLQLTTVAASK